MKDIVIEITNRDEKKNLIFTKIEIFAASLAVILSIADNLDEYYGILWIIPLTCLVLFLIGILSAVNYVKLAKNYENKFDMFFQVLVGLSWIVSSVNLYFMGGTTRMTIIHFLLGIIIIFIFGPLVYLGKTKKLLILKEDHLIIKTGFKSTKKHNFESVDKLVFEDKYLLIKLAGKKEKKYFFPETELIKIKELKESETVKDLIGQTV